MITSPTNARVKYVRRLQSERRFRQREGVFVAEGTRWLQDALHTAVSPVALFFTPEWAEVASHAHLLQQVGATPQPVSAVVMAAMSNTEAPPGVLALLPQIALPLPPAPSLLLILDGVNTPGNMGTMLRTAAAAGTDGVLLAPGCVDVYNPKVVRGSMGAHLRLPIQALDWAEIGEIVRHTAVWGAVTVGGVPYTAVAWNQPSALIIGSEAHGLSPQAAQLCTGYCTIPMAAQTESLNAAVAAAIILFEARRQRGGDG